MIDPLTGMLFFTQAAKLASTLAEQVGNKEMTMEEAMESWESQVASWQQSVKMWRDTPSG